LSRSYTVIEPYLDLVDDTGYNRIQHTDTLSIKRKQLEIHYAQSWSGARIVTLQRNMLRKCMNWLLPNLKTIPRKTKRNIRAWLIKH